MEPMQVALFIVGTVLIIVAAYYVTYYIGVKSSGASRGRNRNINILDRFSISKDKSFCLVEIAGKVYVVAVTNQSMTLLDTLDAATFAGNAAERGGASFRQKTNARPAGGTYSNRMTYKLASFIAAKLGRPDPLSDSKHSNDTANDSWDDDEPAGTEETKAEPGHIENGSGNGGTGVNETGDGSFAQSLRNAQSKGSGDEE